ncbi:putative lipid II flippase FtsW [Virgibacillus xinjiangensis]|uniref:Probable peptidoglycan glycosyltransferase FtsW n=1 Tax=Virgibacillus xinjiangensis TaxID=393090 RepID=A0ABV7CYR9_9BACI
MRRMLRNVDTGLLMLILSMLAFGVMMVYSASFVFAALEYGDASHFFSKQLIWTVLGLLLFTIVSFIPYQLYGKFIALFVGITILLLFLVLVPGIGVERNYSTRWLGIGPLVFQPSEIAKVVMVLYFARVYSKKQDYIEDFRNGFLPPLIMLAFIFFLILAQPDLGTGISIVIACGGILLVSGAKFIHLGGLALVAGSGMSYLAFSADYRLERITSFMNPFADPDGNGFQLVNSYLAIGTSGFSGEGLGNSIQKLGYLPEAHTDFILSIILEELGVFGLLLVIGMYLLFLLKGFQIFKQAPSHFGRLLAFGLVVQITFQAILNMGAISGMMPITGITLPLISYGGSSMVITLISLGVLMNISLQSNQLLERAQS